MANVAWIGAEKYPNLAILNWIKQEQNIDMEIYHGASEGLDAVEKKPYDIVFVNDPVPCKDMELPEDMTVRDFTGVGTTLVEKLRSHPNTKEAKIIVTYMGKFFVPNAQQSKAKSRYDKAGVDEFLNLFDTKQDPLDSFNTTISKYIN